MFTLKSLLNAGFLYFCSLEGKIEKQYKYMILKIINMFL